MSAEIINGKELAAKMNRETAKKIATLGRKPVMAVVLAGDNEASKIYVRNKQKSALEVGIESRLYELPQDVTKAELIKLITELNASDEIDGILVQLPLPAHLNQLEIINLISPNKDVDGFTPYNAGLLALNYPQAVVAATPRGVLNMLKSVCPVLAGKNVVIIGRSNIVGRPLASLLLNQDCTVTLTHTKTKNIKEFSQLADIVIVACGCPRLVKKDWIKNGAIVIDVGINRQEGKLCGDVDFDEVKDVAAHISPVPCGVGPMTIAGLWENMYDLVK